MVLDPKDIVPFLQWFWPGAVQSWLMPVAFVAIGVTGISWLLAVVRHGPVRATVNTFNVLREMVVDIVCISPRRTLALARLAVKEAIRRRVVVVFAVFILILLFAGWFLDPGSINPARLYLDFVLTSTSYLVLLLALFISSLSLPADIKNRTLHTVVTKPVRASEIVLGRIIGFMAVGTILLVVMSAISYGFVVRGLSHTHQLTADDLQYVTGQTGVLTGQTSLVNRHRHKVLIDANGVAHVGTEQGHTHPLTVDKNGGETTYRLGSAEGMLLARVPVYGQLTFPDRGGDPKDRGISVGDEWAYRSYIEGGSKAAAIWTFDGITKQAFPDGLPVELTIEVFRGWKQDVAKGIAGSLSVVNPRTKDRAEVRIFESKEYSTDSQHIPLRWQLPDGRQPDLFKDFVDDGRLQIALECIDPMQYFGAAQADLYLKARDASFTMNFIKGYFGIWLQMLLLVTLGVTFSTFLSGPVAMLATLGALLGGFFNDFMLRLATGQTYGGGPFESLHRMLSQQNVVTPLEPSMSATVVVMLDQVANPVLEGMATILPDFSKFSFAEYVASGFDISHDTLLTFVCRAFAFVIPVFVMAYLCLKNREIAK